jgi:hypothetical protein
LAGAGADVGAGVVSNEAPVKLSTIADTTVAEGKNMGAVPTEEPD